MKKLFFVFGLIAAAGIPAMAQNKTVAPKNVQTQEIPLKTYFGSKMNEFSAYMTRKSEKLAQTALLDMKGMVQKRMTEEKESIAGLNEAGRIEMKKTIETQNFLLNDVIKLSSDLNKNGDAIYDKLKTLHQTL
ncbi:MAG TPA: hypothetical protein VL093_07775 [Flavipsychrobacter sp.]|jgi:hypothetical protein|nr:hypothetical protein [Flavipsychrobacter sp.]